MPEALRALPQRRTRADDAAYQGVAGAAKATALRAATVNKSLAQRQDRGIVGELTDRWRGRVFACQRYVDKPAAELVGNR
jgi:hypothetical protein